MTTTSSINAPDILLVDDGELDAVAAVLDSEGLAYERLRGGQIPADVAPPVDLLIVTPRRVDRVRRGSPSGAAPGRPLRIIAVEEDSPAMRRRLRRSGLHLLVRLPSEPEIWRLLIARAVYQGNERRGDERVAVGSPVAIDTADTADAATTARSASTEAATILLDLSNRGCRLQTAEAFTEGDSIAFTLPLDRDAAGQQEPLTLHGQVRRILHEAGREGRILAVSFDPEMVETSRTRLTALINGWSSGPDSLRAIPETNLPAIPPCELPSIPGLTLDDETDPPVPSLAEIRVEIDKGKGSGEDPDDERREKNRGRYESPLVAQDQNGRFVVIGRDLSSSGMRIERVGHLAIGDRFGLALHGPGPRPPFQIRAEVIREDDDGSFALAFDPLDPSVAFEIEKLVACLPDVESLDEGEAGGLGAILSEIMLDPTES